MSGRSDPESRHGGWEGVSAGVPLDHDWSHERNQCKLRDVSMLCPFGILVYLARKYKKFTTKGMGSP